MEFKECQIMSSMSWKDPLNVITISSIRASIEWLWDIKNEILQANDISTKISTIIVFETIDLFLWTIAQLDIKRAEWQGYLIICFKIIASKYIDETFGIQRTIEDMAPAHGYNLRTKRLKKVYRIQTIPLFKLSTFQYLTDNAFTVAELKRFEMNILRLLGFHVYRFFGAFEYFLNTRCHRVSGSVSYGQFAGAYAQLMHNHPQFYKYDPWTRMNATISYLQDCEGQITDLDADDANKIRKLCNKMK